MRSKNTHPHFPFPLGNNQQELMLGGEGEPDPPGAGAGKEHLISGSMEEEVELLTNQEQ